MFSINFFFESIKNKFSIKKKHELIPKRRNYMNVAKKNGVFIQSFPNYKI